jgi:hypothetical protein
MPEINPIEVIAECIDKCKATTDRDQIAHYISEALGFMQVDEEPENDAFALLGGAIDDAARQDPVRSAASLRSGQTWISSIEFPDRCATTRADHRREAFNVYETA